jgi:hypothetical protein
MVAGYSSDATLPSHRNRGAQPALIAARPQPQLTPAADGWSPRPPNPMPARSIRQRTTCSVRACQSSTPDPWLRSAWPADPTESMVDQDGGWTTTINDRGDVEWTPPPQLDTGQARVNHYRHPERLLHPPDDEDPAMNTTPPNQTPTHHNRTPPNTQASMPRAAIWPRSSTHH